MKNQFQVLQLLGTKLQKQISIVSIDFVYSFSQTPKWGNGEFSSIK
jgi:hypothetical protein